MNSKIKMGWFVRVCIIRIGYITRAICLSYKFAVVNVIKKEEVEPFCFYFQEEVFYLFIYFST